jgi:hypothetical protein
MKYMLLICDDPSDVVEPSPGGMSIDAWVAEMDGRGARLDGDRLRPPADAKTVRFRGGKTVVTDGPFTETKEMIGGYDVIEAADLEEAIEIASKHPNARFGMIEIRPFWVE